MKVIFKMIRYFFIGLQYIISKVLTSKIVLATLIVALFLSLIGVSSDYKYELQKQDKLIQEENISSIIYYHDSEELDLSNDSSINNLINCYKSNINLGDDTKDIESYINKLNSLYRSNAQYFSFLYQDLYSGFTVSYNENAPIFTASTIKAPGMIYLYEQASLKQIDLNEILTYSSHHYSGGSGVLKTKPINTTYSVDELIDYAIHDSDNIAYRMLMEHFKRENMYNFWKEKGCSYIYSNNTIWGFTSAKDASIYMKELYKFYNEDKEYGITLMNRFKNASWKLITDKDGKFNTANKGGWSGTAIHDVAIVFDKNPYILVIMSNLGEGNYNYLFQNTSKLVGILHESYWKYKERVCSNITQY